MDRLTSALSLLLLVAVTVTQAAATAPQLAYWHSVLPNTPIPSALVDLLNFDVDSCHMGKQSFAAMNVKDRNQLLVWRSHSATEKSSVAAMKVKDRNQLLVWRSHSATEKPSVSAMNLKDRNQLFVWRPHSATEKPSVAAMNVKDRNQLLVWRSHSATEKPSVSAMNVKDRNQLLVWRSHSATENHIPVDDPNVSLFFRKEDLRIGAEMNIRFIKTTTSSEAVGFLPREQADSIPFSSAQLTEILNYFSVEPDSPEANAMTNTLNDCEVSTMEREKKYCATSLESMVEFCVSTLGGETKNIKAASTNVTKAGKLLQKYTVMETKPAGDEVVACHRLTYPYPVFGCHAVPASSAHAMTLVGADGSTVEAMAMCHADTSAWDPDLLLFKVLKVKPGSATVCHVMPEQDIVWSRENDGPRSIL